MPLRPYFPTIFSLLFLTTINPGIAQAQIVPDGTLLTDVNNSGNMDKITGGKRVGNNLFYSFEQFSITEGMKAIFDNDLDIENIFTRITGSETSLIDGLLKTAGGANFFLVNPNGIVFGENAQLDVGGSFIATTADSIDFADGTSFVAKDNNPNVTLTISVPVGLGFLGNNGSITVKGSGEQITRQGRFGFTPYLRNRTSGLSVPSEKTLALVGKGVNFDGGVIVTNGGQIELGSVETGVVRLEQNTNSDILKLNYEEVKAFEYINFNQNALLDPSGKTNSLIRIFGNNITITDNSLLLTQNNSSNPDGLIAIEASGLLKVGNGASIVSETTDQKSIEATASPIQISSKNLLIENRGGIASGTFGAANSGDITLNVQNEVKIINSASRDIKGISLFTTAAGEAGDIEINTNQLLMSQGSSISSSTAGGTGSGGNISIDANSIELNGNAIENGAFTFIGSISFGGDAANIRINTAELKISDGAAISSDSSSNAASGKIDINATESIEIIGIEPNQSIPSLITSSVTVQRSEALRAALGLPLNPEGNAGNVNINTPILNIAQGGAVSVRNEGLGSAGTLTINAETLNLNESGAITGAAESGQGANIELNTTNLNITNDSLITSTAGGNENGGNITINTSNLNAKKNSGIAASSLKGDGGNIVINADDSVSLNDGNEILAASEFGNGGNIKLNSDRVDLNNSNITASAGGTGNGGNITVNSDIVTVLDNSSITANADEGNGGNINITADGFFVSPDSTITATSELGIDGEVNIETLSNDIEKELNPSELSVEDLSVEIAKTCLSNQRATFKEGSTTGLPLNSDSDHHNLDFSLTGFGSIPVTSSEENPTSFDEESLIPATHMIETPDGETYLVSSLQEARDLICSNQ